MSEIFSPRLSAWNYWHSLHQYYSTSLFTYILYFILKIPLRLLNIPTMAYKFFIRTNAILCRKQICYTQLCKTLLFQLLILQYHSGIRTRLLNAVACPNTTAHQKTSLMPSFSYGHYCHRVRDESNDVVHVWFPLALVKSLSHFGVSLSTLPGTIRFD